MEVTLRYDWLFVLGMKYSILQDPEGSPRRQLYDDGVKFACWGMSLYSLSCSCYSFMLDKMIKKFGAKAVYIGGQLVYSVGMVGLAITRSK